MNPFADTFYKESNRRFFSLAIFHVWYLPEMPYKSHQEKRMKGKAEMKVQEIEQNMLQSGRGTRPPHLINEILWNFMKEKVSMQAHLS